MTDYRRDHTPGASWFFTLNLADRRQALLTEQIDLLRASFQLRLPVASAGTEEERSYAEFCQRLGAERFHFSITRKP